MQTLDPQTVPLEGVNLIEASAGTGKTFTISWLYLRLVVETGLKVDQILVVTYTKAATAELRDRIRRRLADALAFLENRSCEDDYSTLFASLEENDYPEWIKLYRERLQLALVSFDEAAVFTIHGFCQRILSEHAFEAGLPFESELAASDASLMTELSDHLWRQHLLQPNSRELAILRKHNLTPDSLLEDVRNFIGKPYLQNRISAAPAIEDFEQLQRRYDTALRSCSALWDQEREAIISLLLSGALNGQTYRQGYISGWAAKLEGWFNDATIPDPPLTEAERFSTYLLREKTKKGQMTPQHPFFPLMDQLLETYQTFHSARANSLEALRLQLLDFLREELPRRKQQLGLLTYDDLLLKLQEALTENSTFAQQLAIRFPTALIDEFQDTDPVQYDIFHRIYSGAPEARVFYVGDPKQAIYAFRGADIYTYLQAAKSTACRHTLQRNFRSHEHLLQALNHLFKPAPDPFRSGNGITYEPVEAGLKQEDLFLEPALPPLRIWDWDKLEGKYNKAAVEAEIAAAVAWDITRILLLARQGKAHIGKQPVRSSDIAVLVRSHRQAELIKQALLQRGIVSVQQSRESIFTTHEAGELRALLRAIAEPGNLHYLQQALITELCGYTAADLQALEEHPARLEAELEAFYRWRQIWLTQGFMPMFRAWMRERERYPWLLGFTDGERRLTNLLHLSELIHAESREHGRGIHTLLRWLQQQANAASQAEEEHTLRLESDENLVRIVTIHKSKGLEYGIVYCPFLWNESIHDPPELFNWHDPEQQATYLQARALAEESETRRYREDAEAENLRLLYVALTRAKYHCTVVIASGHIQRFNYHASLTWLLFGHLPDAGQILGKSGSKELSAQERQARMQAQIHRIVRDSDHCIGFAPLPESEPSHYQEETTAGIMAVRALPPEPPAGMRVGSFSGLAAGQEDERPDHDLLAFTLSPNPEDVDRPAPAPANTASTPLAVFPRGAQAGSCLHTMLETLDFPNFHAVETLEILQAALTRHGMRDKWLPAAQMLLARVLQTPILYPPQVTTSLKLAGLPRARRLDELEFYFPVQALSVNALQQTLWKHLPKNTAWKPIHEAIGRLRFRHLQGFMKGYIDLIFETEGKYYIVDYKSNDLGPSPADYHEGALLTAMAEHHYYLQYLIYALALHRHLRQRIADYSWETHVGGVLYLFLRGLNPASVPSGVFFHQPPLACIEALDGLMAHPATHTQAA